MQALVQLAVTAPDPPESELLSSNIDTPDHQPCQASGPLTKNFCQELLRDDSEEFNRVSAEFLEGVERPQPVPPLCGFPGAQPWRELVSSLRFWIDSGQSPLQRLPELHMLSSGDTSQTVVSKLEETVKELGDAARMEDKARTESLVNRLFGELDTRTVLCLLGQRATTGSIPRLPPPLRSILHDFWLYLLFARSTCIEAFNRPHKPPKAHITTGARALTKHCHRDETAGFWGNPTGTEAVLFHQ